MRVSLPGEGKRAGLQGQHTSPGARDPELLLMHTRL